MLKTLSRTAFIGTIVGSLCARAPSVQWMKFFFGSEHAIGHAVQQTLDKGFIAVGRTYTGYGGQHTDFYLVKTDSLGNIQWEKIINRGVYDEAFWVKQTKDRGFALLGTKDDWPIGAYFIKTDSLGNAQWEKVLFGGDTIVYGFGLEYTKDNCYVIVLQTWWDNDSLPKIYLIKMDSSGNRLWGKTLCMTNYESPQDISIHQTKDGGYIIGTNDITKTDSAGNFQWTRTFDIYDVGYAPFVIQTSDGGYIAAGMGKSNSNPRELKDISILKTDSLGNFRWRKTFGGNDQDVGLWVQQTEDGGYIIAGHTYSFGVYGDCYIIKTDSFGNLSWTKRLNRQHSEATAIQQTADGGYIVTGTAPDPSVGKIGLYLLKLAPAMR
jgi:hypothetical protein